VLGLGGARRVLMDRVVEPALRGGARAPPDAVLLYGAAGAGKTHLARGLASALNAKLLAVPAEALLAANGVRLLRAAFRVARRTGPTMLLLVDADFAFGRCEAPEGSSPQMRLRAELLAQLDGSLKAGGGSDVPGAPPADGGRYVLVVCATRRPEALCAGLVRALRRQLLVPLPGVGERADVLLRAWEARGGAGLGAAQAEALAWRTAGCSCGELVRAVHAVPSPLTVAGLTAAVAASTPSVPAAEAARLAAWSPL